MNAQYRFRRPTRPLAKWNTNASDSHLYDLTKEDILATDWEIEEQKIEITESEFWCSYADSLKHLEDKIIGRFDYPDVITELKKRLFGKETE